VLFAVENSAQILPGHVAPQRYIATQRGSRTRSGILYVSHCHGGIPVNDSVRGMLALLGLNPRDAELFHGNRVGTPSRPRYGSADSNWADLCCSATLTRTLSTGVTKGDDEVTTSDEAFVSCSKRLCARLSGS